MFARQRDGRRFATPVETTQSNADDIRYWASGLLDTYLEGALDRALARGLPVPAAVRVAIESDLLELFRETKSRRLLAQRAFDELPFAHADIVRAIEDLEKRHRLVLRRTEEGNDWIELR